ncbi:lysis protein [Xenorhabdus griffiniae]|uniref:Lysis protein n=1 Tax=Xenorhabdus griffiniae TaxID=351672 RepID=A0ABY9XEB4_9GAMM|nr:lysis protein [Xenorhabdus griffiniae]MBD1229102.1 lysis protein [Xenorhabdus griffiniae]MBE8588814.1 lysis protein [Xenorhabdus griffiniae]WMV71250.1 lysis protein [Xenorhabdus griffiniae]WNH00926.1 lysis protein [Xenorhabdus griffiniae]
MSTYEKAVFVIIVGLIAWSSWLKVSLNEANDLNKKLTTDLSEQVAINANQQERIQQLHERDTKRLQELTNAKTKIDQLSDDLRTNIKRVYVKAECPVSETTSPSGVDGSRPARLAKDAEQDYVRLLGELEILEAQFLGLREWAKTECGRTQ